MVVALRDEFGRVCRLRVLVCGLVLHFRAGDHWRGPVDALLRVHDAGQRHLLPRDRHDRVLRLFMVREQDLRVHQGGLGPLPFLPRVSLGTQSLVV